MGTEFKKTQLNDLYGLSCIENFLLYAMKTEGYKYKHLYYESYLSMCDIINEFINNNTKYASFYKITRLQKIAADNDLIAMEFFNNTDFRNNITKYEYNTVMVNPEYIKEKYKTELWRDDHYILVAQKDSDNFYYLNDNPRDNGVISYDELRRVYSGKMIGFTIKNEIGKELQNEFLKIFIDSVFRSSFRTEFNYTDLTIVRDILGILKVLRKRICDYCGMYIPMDFYRDFLLSIDRFYSSIEYMRLRNTIDFDKINRQFDELQEKDIELITVLHEKMRIVK